MAAPGGLVCVGCGGENPADGRFCSYCGGALAEQPRLGHERRVVSVVFADLVGFTGLSEGVDVEDVRGVLGVFHGGARGVLERFGGTVEKFIGDAVVAVFGAPVAHEDDAERAVRAGLAVVEAVAALEAVEGLGLAVRVGVNTGEALVALDARVGRGEGLVAGDSVNIAARIQAATPVGAVAVGGGTYRATRRVFEYAPLAAVSAKGKAQPLEVWQAIAPRGRVAVDAASPVGLVGRQVELSRLCGLFEEVARGRTPRFVTIVGEPGVGKSRLVAELGGYVDSLDRLVRWRVGRCPPYGEQITFRALSEIVKADAGIYDNDPPRVARQKLQEAIPDTDEHPWLLARLLPLVGIETNPAEQPEMFAAWRRYLEGLAQRDPFVVVVEDIHWADDALLGFLEYLADATRHVTMLLVCTARPELYERRPDWTEHPNSTTLNLDPLTNADTTRLITTLLHQTVLPADTQTLLLERAGGNPLYAEEFVRMLHDTDTDDGVDLPVPETIQALIAARLDTLPTHHKALLQDAAIIGEVFWDGALATIGDRDPTDVADALDHLTRARFLRPAGRSTIHGHSEWRFWHALTRDGAYTQIPRTQRATRHLDAAAWLEQAAGESLEDHVEALANHTHQALTLAIATRNTTLQTQAEPAAARYALLAGKRALGLDTTTALIHLDRALTLTPDTHPDHPHVLLAWADAARQAGRHKDAAPTLQHAAHHFHTHGDHRHAGQALTLLAEMQWFLGDPDYLTTAQHAATTLQPHPGPEHIDALTLLANAHLVTGDHRAAIDMADRALHLAHKLGLPTPACTLGYRGLARSWQGDPYGLTELEQAITLLTDQGRSHDSANLQGILAALRYSLEGPAAANTQVTTTVAYAEQRGINEITLAANAMHAVFLFNLGRLDDVTQLANTAAPHMREAGNLNQLRTLLVFHALALTAQGTDPSSPTEEVLEMGTIGSWGANGFWAAGIATALIAAGDVDTARSLLTELADLPQTFLWSIVLPALTRAALELGDPDLTIHFIRGMPDILPDCQHALAAARAILAEQTGRQEAAAALYADAAERWRTFTAPYEQAHALLGQGRCLTQLAALGAGQPLRHARSLFAGMGAHRYVVECDALLAVATTPEQPRL